MSLNCSMGYHHRMSGFICRAQNQPPSYREDIATITISHFLLGTFTVVRPISDHYFLTYLFVCSFYTVLGNTWKDQLLKRKILEPLSLTSKGSKETAFLVRIFHVFLWTCSKLEHGITRKAGWIDFIRSPYYHLTKTRPIICNLSRTVFPLKQTFIPMIFI